MKTKIVKVKSSKDLTKRVNGEGVFRITGPCIKTGQRVTEEFEGTRDQAKARAATIFR